MHITMVKATRSTFIALCRLGVISSSTRRHPRSATEFRATGAGAAVIATIALFAVARHSVGSQLRGRVIPSRAASERSPRAFETGRWSTSATHRRAFAAGTASTVETRREPAADLCQRLRVRPAGSIRYTSFPGHLMTRLNHFVG